MEFDIQAELKKLPDRPGVYLMHDAQGRILYVGKAISLKNRVKSYFAPNVNRGPQILKMIREIAWFEVIVVGTEAEALMLECNLIKEHRPPYNTQLMDDKGYPYIALTREDYPRVMKAQQLLRDGREYFGPYMSRIAVNDTVRLLQNLFQLRDCKRALPETVGRGRPCQRYDMKLCPAPCRGGVTREEYGASVEQARDFLRGNYEPVKRLLQQRMQRASDELKFEEAAVQRDLLYEIESLAEKQKVSATGEEDLDVAAVAAEGEEGIAEFFFVRGGRMIGHEHHHLNLNPDDAPAAVISQVLKQFYSGTPLVPRQILTETEPEEKDAIETALSLKSGHRVEIHVPAIGEKKRLVEMAGENALRTLQQDRERVVREEARTAGAQKKLCELLGLPEAVRLESYDISHIAGFNAVGSMVVYEKGRPRRTEYRLFRLRLGEGGDDTASMTEVLERRFTHGLQERSSLREAGLEKEEQGGSFVHFPDLILMDGGLSQVHAAEEVLQRLDLNIPVCGMVKDDRHRTRALLFQERELPLDSRSEEFQLLTRIQDEVHRFAISYHRNLRSGEQVHSLLEDIPGVGPARRRALMREFKNLEEIKAADTKTLAAIPEIGKAAARQIYAFFHEGEVQED